MALLQKLPLLALAMSMVACQQAVQSENPTDEQHPIAVAEGVQVAAERTQAWLPLLKDKRVGLVVNHTATIGSTHLVDSMLGLGLNITAIFGPEHGFRGTAADGETVDDSKDLKTGIPVYSLYRGDKKPTREQLAEIDVLVFDIQDVGVRFYTFISTMHKCMEACADAGVPFIVFDRPNPHGNSVDGPVLEMEHQSFVGMHPIPLLHGLTVAELARMIQGEGWLGEERELDLTVVTMKGWSHADYYELPIAPSPNLPNQLSIMLYPSLGLFEGSSASIGRGTDHPFQLIGHPDFGLGSFAFKPESRQESKYPKHEGKQCFGTSLINLNPEEVHSAGLNLSWLVGWHEDLSRMAEFYRGDGYFEKLAGTRSLRKQLADGWTQEQIRESWQEELQEYRLMRESYLLYD